MREYIKAEIMKECERHKIRLAPKEFEELVDNYMSRFVTNIDVPSLIKLSEYVIRRNK